MKKSFRIVAVAALVVSLAGLSAAAGNIPGMLLNPRGAPHSHIFTSVNIYGSSTSGTGTTATNTDGIFYWSGLPAGTYSQAFSEKESFELLYRKNIGVPASGDAAWTVLQYDPAVWAPGTEWYYTWHTVYCQSFRATGENVISVGLRTAGASGTDVAVAILNGDGPYGAQIGPTRTLGVSSTNGQCAYWSAGEVPTVPGQIYTVKLTLPGGGQFSPWRQTVRNFMRSENPNGRNWVDGAQSDEPLELTVNQDDAGLINTMCCARTVMGTWFTNEVGQTFTAKGDCVLAITWMTGVNKMWAISVHDGVGGPQVGPTKYVYGVAWDGRAVVSFGPNEVPTTPGHVYYVKFRVTVPPDAGENYVMYHCNADYYSGGIGYRDGAAQYYDWCVGVYEEKSPGSIDVPKVSMSSLGVSPITSTTAVVNWTTGVLADGAVEWGETTPYEQADYNSSLATSHSFTLTGLKPNTMYHVRASSRRSGYRDNRTRDVVFVTAPDRPNLLADAGFESGVFGAWTKFGAAQFAPTGWFGGTGARTGSWGVGGATNGGNINGGVYQRVMAQSGRTYQLSAWVRTYCTNVNVTKGYLPVTRIGIDPYGGTDPASINVMWTPYTISQDAWTHEAMAAVAMSDYITVFLYGANDTPVEWAVWSFDDVILTGPQPDAMTLGQAVADAPDGTLVQMTNVKCVSTEAQQGQDYVEATDRSCALRVKTGDTMSIGDRVTVVGTMTTRANGERQLDSAVVVAKAASTDLKPLLARANAIGGASPGDQCPGIPGTLGAYNVGMLMRITGKVTASASGYIWVNDGSLPGDGLKVATGAISTIPAVGKTVGLTGISRIEGTAGSATTFLKPRKNADVTIY